LLLKNKTNDIVKKNKYKQQKYQISKNFSKTSLKSILIPKVFTRSKRNVLKNNELIKSKIKRGGVLPPELGLPSHLVINLQLKLNALCTASAVTTSLFIREIERAYVT
jgi:hypothetical protein